MLGLSGGCEPEFALSYTRHTDNLADSYKVYCKSVKEYIDTVTTDDNIEESDLPEYFITSADINWKRRVLVQSTMQKYVDTAISSTINLDENTPISEVEKIYLNAWENGLKGITIFRSGCKRVAILNTSESKAKEETAITTTQSLPRGAILNCSNDVIGKKRKLQTGCGSLHVAAFFDPDTGDLQELYLSKGSTGGCQNFMIGLSRMISLACRAGVDISAIKDQLDSTGACPSYAVRSATHHDTSKGSCCPMAIGNALVEMQEEIRKEIADNNYISFDDVDYDISDATELDFLDEEEEYKSDKCPECGATLVHEGGCDTCKNCGWSHCA